MKYTMMTTFDHDDILDDEYNHDDDMTKKKMILVRCNDAQMMRYEMHRRGDKKKKERRTRRISLSDLIKQNTLGQSEAFPAGVPDSYSWYKGWIPGGQMTPPAGFTAVEGWGQVYTEEGAPAASPSADVEVANAVTYVHIKETGQWVLVQDQSKLGIGGGFRL